MYSFYIVLARITVEVTEIQRLTKLCEGERLVLARSSDQAFCAAKMYDRGKLRAHLFKIGERNYEVIVADELELSQDEVQRQMYSAGNLHFRWVSSLSLPNDGSLPNGSLAKGSPRDGASLAGSSMGASSSGAESNGRRE